MKGLRLLAIFAGSLAIAACSSSSNNNDDALGNPIPATGVVQFQHAVADAPTVDIVVDGTTRYAGVPYKTASDFVALLPGSYPVQVLANLPDGTQLPVFDDSVTVTADTVTTVTVLGSVVQGNVTAQTFDQPRTEVPADSARLFIIHAYPGEDGTAPVKVEVALPMDPEGTDLLGTPVIDFGDTLGPVDVAEGTYRVTIRPAPIGDAMVAPIYQKEITVADGDNLRLVAVQNVSGGDAALTLMAVSASGSADLLDDSTPAFLRLGHLAADAPPVDIIATAGETEITLLDDVAFPAIDFIDGFRAVDAAEYDVRIETADNTMIVLPSGEDPILLDLAAGSVTQVFAVNPAEASTEIVDLIVSTNSATPVATGAFLQVVHAASAAGTVDVYILPAGTGTTEGAVDEGVDPTIAGFAYQAVQDYLYVPGGTEEAPVAYDVCVTVVDTADCAIFVGNVPVPVGAVATAVATDAPEDGLGLELLFDYPRGGIDD